MFSQIISEEVERDMDYELPHIKNVVSCGRCKHYRPYNVIHIEDEGIHLKDNNIHVYKAVRKCMYSGKTNPVISQVHKRPIFCEKGEENDDTCVMCENCKHGENVNLEVDVKNSPYYEHIRLKNTKIYISAIKCKFGPEGTYYLSWWDGCLKYEKKENLE